jgi:hypothetical protein
MVTFMSDTGSVAAAPVGAGGTYELKSAGKPQVLAGKYRVMVTDPPAAAMSQEDYNKMMNSGGKMPDPKAAVIPAKYASTTTSELSFEVKAEANTINIELK